MRTKLPPASAAALAKIRKASPQAAAKIEALYDQLEELQKQLPQPVPRGRPISPSLAKVYLALDARVTQAEIAKGLTPRPMSETHPETYAELCAIAGVPVKKSNGASGAPKPSWTEGIL